MYPIKPQTHPNSILAIETIRDKCNNPDNDTIYHKISKSEATTVDHDFIASILNNLESQNAISTTQQHRAIFI